MSSKTFGFIMCVVFLGCNQNASVDPIAQDASRVTPKHEEAARKPSAAVTNASATVKRLRRGMTLDEVEQALGAAEVAAGIGDFSHWTMIFEFKPDRKVVVLHFNRNSDGKLSLSDWLLSDYEGPDNEKK